MTAIRSLLEAWFESFAHCLFDNRYKILVMILLFLGIMASRLPGPCKIRLSHG